jgi:Spy/CpxP family protein refolding chaperone
MNNTRFLKIVIAVLVLVNLGTLAFLWFNRPGSDSSIQPPFSSGFLVNELDLSKSQRQEYFQLRRNHRLQLEKLQEKDHDFHNRFFEQLFSEVPDSGNVGELADSIAENRRKMEVLTYDHFMHLKQMLTADQQKKFESIFDEVLRRVLPAPPSPPSVVPPPLLPPQPPPIPPMKNK